MSKISHILLPHPVVVSTGTKLWEAAKLMKIKKVASALVSKNGRLAGIISIEDIVHSVGEKMDLNMTVDEAMHSPQITIESDKWLTDAIIMFEQSKVFHIAVVENGEKVGIMRVNDILHTYKFNKEGQT